jgi:hypothetical protein
VEWEGVLEDRWVGIERDLEAVGRKAWGSGGDGPGELSECLINTGCSFVSNVFLQYTHYCIHEPATTAPGERVLGVEPSRSLMVIAPV